MKVTNKTERPIVANVGGKTYVVNPGKSTTAPDARTALILGEYGLTLEDRNKAIAEQDAPATQGETRHTGGRQHRADDPRVNPAGTPVTVTGDTGSTTTEPGVQGPTAAEVAERRGGPAASDAPGTQPSDQGPAAPPAATGDEGDGDEGDTTPASELKGDALAAAVAAANASGAEIDTRATADDRRKALAAWQAKQ